MKKGGKVPDGHKKWEQKKRENARGKSSGREKPLGTDHGQPTPNPLALQGWWWWSEGYLE